MRRIEFFVHGVAQPQGSMRAFVVKGKPILTSTNKNLADWRRLIAAAAQEHAVVMHGAVSIIATFALPRPKSLPRRQVDMIRRPDIDKLARAILDALTGIFYNDDSQVHGLNVVKIYATPTRGPGVRIVVMEGSG